MCTSAHKFEYYAQTKTYKKNISCEYKIFIASMFPILI